MATTWLRVATALSFARASVVRRARVRQGRSYGSVSRGRSAFIEVHPEVEEALRLTKPVVALETTIVTHGMPYPQNRETAQQVEDIVRSYSVVPATIGVLNGRIHIGLTSSQLDRLADPNQLKMKIARRDLPVAINKCLNGGLTVSAVLFIAHQVGIPIFVTGGMGGVHRDAHISFDISADLTELGRTPMGVVSAGIKSILDIPRSLEMLETMGVTVVTYGSSKEFPAFFTAKSGCYIDTNVESPLECAQLLDINIRNRSRGGVLIAVPPPVGVVSEGDIEEAIQLALAETKDKSIVGKAVTPYVLERVNQLTKDASLKANIALILNNAHVGSQIARELASLAPTHVGVAPQIVRGSNTASRMHNISSNVGVVSRPEATPTQSKPIIVGASILDIITKVKGAHISELATNISTIGIAFGGVARNIAECMARIDCQPLLVSPIGSDETGKWIINHMKQLNMTIEGLHLLSDRETAMFCQILDSSGEWYRSFGDLSIIDDLTTDWVMKFISESTPLVCIDGNVSPHVLKTICQRATVPIWFEPTCIDKSARPIEEGVLNKLSYATPNIFELQYMYNAMEGTANQLPPDYIHNATTEKVIEHVRKLSKPLLKEIQHLLVTLGQHGVVYMTRDESLHYFAKPANFTVQNPISVSGSGDCLAAATMGSMVKGMPINEAIKVGLYAAHTSLLSRESVGPATTSNVPRAWMDIEPIRIPERRK